MSLAILKNKIILAIFFVWIFSVAVWGEAPAGAMLFVILAFFSLFVAITKVKHLIKIVGQYPLLLFFWVLFLLSLIASCFFTINLPLSIKELVFYFSLFLFFWQVLLFKNFILENKNFFIMGLIATTTCLVFLSFVLSLPLTNEIDLPTMNILRPIAGHNHLAAWLLLVLPITWWWFFDQYKNFKAFFLVIFNIALYLSLGRVALFLGLLQFLLVVFFLRKTIFIKFTCYLKSLLFFGAVLVVGLLLLRLNDIHFKFFTHSTCLSCKSLSLQSRFYYWQQAIDGFKLQPIFGFGIGTFRLLNTKFYQLPGYQSAYAHNIFFNFLAETGIFGILSFLFLIGYLFFLVINNTKKNKVKFEYILLITVLSSFFNALLDFDWHFNVIILLTMFYLALLLDTKKKQDKKIRSLAKNSSLVLFYTLAVLVTSYYLVLYVSSTFFSSCSLARTFDLFPFFYQHRDYYLNIFSLNHDSRMNRLVKIYWFDPEFLTTIKTKSLDQKSFSFYHHQLRVLHPWYGIYHDQIDLSLSLNDPELAKQELNNILLFLADKKAKYNFDLKYELWLELIDKVLRTGDVFFENKEYKQAGQLYHLAQTLDPWILSKHQPIFLKFKTQLSHLEFFQELQAVDPKYFGYNNLNYGKYLHSLVVEELKAGNPEKALLALKLNLRITPWNNHQLWIDILPVFEQKLAGELIIASNQEPTVAPNLVYHDTLCQIADFNKKDVGVLWPATLKKKYVISLQKAANLALMIDDKARAETYIKTMKLLNKDEYWPLAQMGHFYVYLGSNGLGLGEFEVCLKNFNDQHDDCFYGKKSILDGRPNKSRYFQVSKIILGEKNWWDF